MRAQQRSQASHLLDHIERHARLIGEREVAATRRRPQTAYARDAIEEFETLSPVEILQRTIDQRARDIDEQLGIESRAENVSDSPDESQNSNPSSVITSYQRTLHGSPFSVEEPPSHAGETVGTITVSPISTYSDVEYSNSSEHPSRTLTITECTESVSENETSPRPPAPTFPPDDEAPR